MKEVSEYEILEKRKKQLQDEGKILSKDLQNELASLGVVNDFGEYYLEDLLKVIPFIKDSNFFKMFYDSQKNCVVMLDSGRPPSEEIRAEGQTFVNTMALFVIRAIERGFVTSRWDDFLKRGLEKSEYYCRSRLISDEGNWILGTFNRMFNKK